jgi:hypothetical protein
LRVCCWHFVFVPSTPHTPAVHPRGFDAGVNGEHDAASPIRREVDHLQRSRLTGAHFPSFCAGANHLLCVPRRRLFPRRGGCWQRRAGTLRASRLALRSRGQAYLPPSGSRSCVVPLGFADFARRESLAQNFP